MEKFTTLTGVAAPLDAANVDTDQIIPKQFLLAVDRKGFGVHLFHERRYLDDAETIAEAQDALAGARSECQRAAATCTTAS